MKSRLFVFSLLASLVLLSVDSTDNPEELGGKFQGDMILTKKQFNNVMFGQRNGLISKEFRWPKHQGKVIVPYMIKPEFTADEKREIRESLNKIEEHTCIRFKEGRAKDYIGIIAGRGCYSQVGKKGGLQILSLQRKTPSDESTCIERGVIIHEFVHALGFFHMQSAYDRDNFVKINFENIDRSQLQNFAKHSNQYTTHFGIPYDLDSLMHYPKNAFSKNGRNTMEARNPKFNDRIGQRVGLSYSDVNRINKMYECEGVSFYSDENEELLGQE